MILVEARRWEKGLWDMGSSAGKGHVDHPEVIANRYRADKVLGKGGMGVVYQVYDTSTARHVALKQLLPADDDDNSEIMALFEREFHTLSHLSHPRVIEVYDYGKNEIGPYYTMELLDGGDLSELSPVPWATACALLRDVCSALSLLHSRRLVHRDLTTRNIRCTKDQRAKLIDFGAMIPVGPCKTVVGTPLFVAPEALNGQVVDARTDLFSLGATAYFALTRRHAYRTARTFAALRDAWRTQPLPPSALVPEIPKELDDLVISLVNLDVMARPTSAAEVMERLTAIAGLQVDEQLVVRQAYLSTPTLVGRNEPLLRARKQIVRAIRGRGGTLMIEGAAGTGRSRFLDACVLEGKLAGALVVRADAADANAGSWGAVQSMAQQLIDAAPQAALSAARPLAPVLGHVLPELLSRLDEKTPQGLQTTPPADDSEGCDERRSISDRVRRSVPPPPPADSPVSLKTFDSPKAMRPEVQAALCDWLLEICKHKCVVVAVDDVHRIDEPSAAFVALLTDPAPEQRLVVAATAEANAPATAERAVRLLSEVGATIELTSLTLEDTERLLTSVFGEVRNIRLLADRLHAISRGNPRAVMQLAQHLLDNGLLHYEAGTWTLPSSIDATGLPQTLSDALKARIQKLSPTALELAQAMALCSKQAFSFDDCSVLRACRDKTELVRDLDQLVAADILSTDGTSYTVCNAKCRTVLTQGMGEERARALHLRLAELLEADDTEHFLRAQHLLRARESERALDAFLENIRIADQRHREDPVAYGEYMNALPQDWVETCETFLALCQQLGRPRKQGFLVRAHLVGCAAAKAEAQQAHLNRIFAQLRRDTGLDLYAEQDDSLDGTTRLMRALELAQKRFDATPESQRVLPPADAIRRLVEVIIDAIGGVANANDYAFFEALPSLEPLVPLSPALSVVEKNVRSTAHLLAGRADQARQGWLEILERLAEPDRAGIQEPQYTYVRLGIMYAVGTIEVQYGLQSAVKWIDEIEKDPACEINAWLLRMIMALRQGDFDRAEECKKRVELLYIRNSPSQLFEGTLLLMELLSYAACEDLLRVKQTLSGIEKMAERYEGWVPRLHYARGEYQRIRGDYDKALVEFERALSTVLPGRDVCWSATAAARLSTLLSLTRFSEAEALGQEAVEAAEREELGSRIAYLRQPVALAQAALGEFDAAVENCKAVIDCLEELGATGLVLGSAFETRARVALMMSDHEGFVTYLRLCAQQYRVGQNPALTAKYEKLMTEARRTSVDLSSDLGLSSASSDQGQQAMHAIGTLLQACHGRQHRAERALTMLVDKGRFAGGLLYTMQDDGVSRAAESGDQPPPVDVDALVAAYLSAELDEAEDVTITEADLAEGSADAGVWKGPDGQRFVPVTLGHDTEAGFAITGVAVLCVDPAKEPAIPFRLLSVVSQSLLEAGDAVTAFAAI